MSTDTDNTTWSQSAKTQEQQEISKLVTNLSMKNGSHAEQTSEESADVVSSADASLLQKIIRKGLDESKSDVEVLRKDPSSPLYSVKSFEALKLKPELLKGVYEMGFNSPSEIQATALPTLLADPPQNMIAQSPFCTDKTATFVLAMLSRVDTTKDYPQVLCLSPTIELAIQTGEVAAKMAQYCPIKIRFAVRGEEVGRGEKINEHIIIGTPGKVLDWCTKYKVFDIKKITVFVLDKGDVMIATQEHQDQYIRIHKQLSPRCQNLYFLATCDPSVMESAEHSVKNPIIIRVQGTLYNIKQYYVQCKNQDEKYQAIQNIFGVITVKQAIIYCITPKTASWLASKLSANGHSVRHLNDLDQFRGGMEKLLITTKVFCYGIHVEQVNIVVNFDLPKDVDGEADCETYYRRIGRTGCFGKTGIAINLVDTERSMQICQTIGKHFQQKIYLLDAKDADEIEKIKETIVDEN